MNKDIEDRYRAAAIFIRDLRKKLVNDKRWVGKIELMDEELLSEGPKLDSRGEMIKLPRIEVPYGDGKYILKFGEAVGREKKKTIWSTQTLTIMLPIKGGREPKYQTYMYLVSPDQLDIESKDTIAGFIHHNLKGILGNLYKL